MLDQNILDQLKGIFASLDASYILRATIDPNREEAQELISFLSDFASTSEHIDYESLQVDDNSLCFSILKDGNPTGISFCGIPGGHEFTSLLLAILNADGKGKNLPDEALRRRISLLHGDINLRTFISLSCTNCPDVVQALNIIALLNPTITHEMVDGALFPDEAEQLHV